MKIHLFSGNLEMETNLKLKYEGMEHYFVKYLYIMHVETNMKE